MASINIYLNFPGSTEEAFQFYRSIFGGEFSFLQRYGEIPDGDKLPSEDQQKIMHISLPVGNHSILMGSDSLKSVGQQVLVGNNFYVSLSVESENLADNYFQKLSVEGKVEMPMQKMFWGDYFGMIVDRYGIQWMVSVESKA